MLADLRQPAFHDEQTRRFRAGVRGSGRRALIWLAHPNLGSFLKCRLPASMSANSEADIVANS
jgi:hypothetical protein